MKKGLLIPAAVLAAVLAFCLWNSAVMTALTSRWQEALAEADRLVREENWADAATAIEECYLSWSDSQTYLHCVTNHDAVDDAEAMYQRALAFAERQEDSELRAELADLQAQLRLLAEMEEFSLKNVL